MIFDIVKRQKPGFAFEGIYGKTHGRSFTVCYHSGGANSFKPIFYGMISEHPYGTIITGHFQISTVVTIVLWLWRVMVSIFLLFFILIAIFSSEPVSILSLLIPILMLLFSFIIRRIGATGDKEDKVKVLKFFEVELLATLYGA